MPARRSRESDKAAETAVGCIRRAHHRAVSGHRVACAKYDTRMVNFREGWRGHLWQARFASFVLDEPHLLTAARYVELNPVRARLVNAPSRYRCWVD